MSFAGSSWHSVTSPLFLRSLRIKNRIYLPSHTYGFVREGRPTADYLPYLRARINGGVSLVVLGETLVPDETTSGNDTWGGAVSGPWLEKFYERASAAALREDAHIFEQLYHPGGQVWQTPGATGYAPSRIHHSTSALVPWALTSIDILRIIHAFSSAAKRAVLHGVSGIELKADQGKLHHQFLSPRFNRRNDSYGSSAGGSRFLRDSLTGIRESIGDLPVIGVRFPTADGWEFEGEGTDVRELSGWLRELLNEISSWGIVDYISLSHGTNSTRPGYRVGHSDESLPDANAMRVAIEARSLTDLPLFVSSNIRSLSLADSLLREGLADMVGMVRAHIADPEIVNKTLLGQVEGVRPCIASNQGCVGNTWVGRPIRCTVNPEAGRERLVAIRTPRSRLRVAIVGGGPAGLESAIRLGRAGCTVTVYERNSEVGGQLRTAGLIPGRQGFGTFIEYLERQLLLLDTVKVLRNCEVRQITDLYSGNDAVIVASGGMDPQPWSLGFEELPSEIASLPKWMSPTTAVLSLAQESLTGTILVFDQDWTQSALGIAANLARRGLAVTYATALETAGGALDYVTQTVWLGELRRRGVKVLTSVETYAADVGVVILRDIVGGQLIEISDVSRLVMAISPGPSGLLGSAKDNPKMRVIGDARFPRGLEFALADSADAAYSLLRPSRNLRGSTTWDV